jgi:hypothetical protein
VALVSRQAPGQSSWGLSLAYDVAHQPPAGTYDQYVQIVSSQTGSGRALY